MEPSTLSEARPESANPADVPVPLEPHVRFARHGALLAWAAMLALLLAFSAHAGHAPALFDSASADGARGAFEVDGRFSLSAWSLASASYLLPLVNVLIAVSAHAVHVPAWVAL